MIALVISIAGIVLSAGAAASTLLLGWPPNDTIPWYVSGTISVFATLLFLVVNLSARAHRLEEERTPALRIIFEPRAPWVERVEKAVTQPRSNPAAPLSEWVETDSRWFKPQIQNTSPVKTARQVRVYLTNVEMMKNGKYEEVGFGTSQLLRWSNQKGGEFDPKDISHLARFQVDVLSVDAEHQRIFVKWRPPEWQVNEKLFDAPSQDRKTAE
jgi:hypothetical protein